MDKKFNLSNLVNIYRESIARNEPTLAFELKNGHGRFLFLMFFDDEDESTKDKLYIFMKNTQRMLCIKMYGNHDDGQFVIYLKPMWEKWFKEELLLNSQTPKTPFIFDLFLMKLNLSIPHQLSLEDKIQTLRRDWNQIKNDLPIDVIDESEKIYLIGPKKLSKNRKPREKTLRKLYLYTEASVSDVEGLIDNLKRMNMTLAWSASKEKSIKGVSEIINSLN